MQIDSLDHLALTISDIGVSIAFDSRVLGMEVITFGPGRQALGFGGQKINGFWRQGGLMQQPSPALEVALHLAGALADVEIGPFEHQLLHRLGVGWGSAPARRSVPCPPTWIAERLG